MGGEEAEGQVGGEADADTGSDLDGFGDPAMIEDLDGAGGEKDEGGVVGAGDLEGLGEAAGAVDTLDGADEDTAGGAVGFGDEIEALVDPIDEIDVGAAGGSEDDFGAGGNAAEGVGGLVIGGEVSFDFGDGGGEGGGDEEFAEEGAGDGDGIAAVEGFRERRVGRGGEQWVD